MSDSIVIIPTYNEKENIENIIRYVLKLKKEFDILVIDDGSPDGTADIVKKIVQEQKGRVFLEQRKGKLGLGTAYIHGFRWALDREYQYIFEMDADFSHPPKKLVDLYNACAKSGADVAVGSRYLDGKISVVNWPIGRVIMSYYASVFVRLVLGINICDATAGFVCYSRKVLERIDFNKIQFIGYAFQIEMKYTAYKLGFKIKEVPIIFTDRVYGQSKMSMKIFKEAFLGVFKLRFRNWKQY